MSIKSTIEWTHATWNPVRGCSKISPGCLNCYAHTFAERWRGIPGHAYEQGFDLRLVPEKLGEPLRWSESKMIFVNSMSDLFHEEVPDEYIVQVVKVMAAAYWHIFQVLTKRPERMVKLLKTKLREFSHLSHIWWGVSVENQKHGLPRVKLLQSVDVAVRFLSCEPLLESLGSFDLTGISWTICGGESGPGARPMAPEWARELRDRCVLHNVPFFMKQWGGTRKKVAGRILDGRTWDEFPSIGFKTAPDKTERLEILSNAAV